MTRSNKSTQENAPNSCLKIKVFKIGTLLQVERE